MERFGTTRRWLGIACAAGMTLLGCGSSTSSEQRGGSPSGGAGATGGTGLAGGGASPGGAGTTGAAGTPTGATGGTGGASAGSGNPGGAPPVEPDISGDWGMFVFEDPVGVTLQQDGNRLTGYGCCAGLPSRMPDAQCCGSIEGSIVNGRAQFSFDNVGSPAYSADVLVSADGRRMLGSFVSPDFTMAWARVEGAGLERGWLVSMDTALNDVIIARSNSYALILSSVPPAGGIYSPSTAYRLTIIAGNVPAIYGDLGPFWAGEMSWSEAEQTLAAGPVPVTDPAYPIAVRLVFDDRVLINVEAEMASGDSYTFAATVP